MTTETETTALATFPKLNLPDVTGITEQMNKSFGTMYTRIEQGIAELPTDMTVAANRQKVASYAYSISRTKTGLDEAAAGVAVEAKAIVDSVNGERKTLKTTLDGLRDKARAPLDAWEAAEKARQDRVAAERQKLSSAPASSALMTAEQLRETINYLDKPYSAAEYGEDAHALIALREETRAKLSAMIEIREREDRERAELEELRAFRAAQQEKERLAAEAREAEKAAALEAEREKERQRVAEIERQRIAEEARATAEREAAEKVAAAQKAVEEAAEREQAAEARRVQEAAEASERAAAAQAEAVKRAREEAEAQRVAEQEQAEALRRRQEQADRERAADLAHRRKLNAEASKALATATGLSEKEAQAVIIAIYKEQVPHVAISY